MNQSTLVNNRLSQAVLAALLIAPSVSATDIKFQIKGVNSEQGKIYVQLFQGEENYKNQKPASSMIVNAKKGDIALTFNGMEQGEYALRFYHDENNNGQLETNLFGIPTEGYGFSNNAVPNFGPVSYEQIKFEVAASNTEVKNFSQVIY